MNVNRRCGGARRQAAEPCRTLAMPTPKPFGSAANESSSQPADTNMSRMCWRRSGCAQPRVQTTTPPDRTSEPIDETTCWMSASEMLPKMPHSIEQSTGSTSAQVVTSPASAQRTVELRDAGERGVAPRSVGERKVELDEQRGDVRERGCAATTGITSRPSPAQGSGARSAHAADVQRRADASLDDLEPTRERGRRVVVLTVPFVPVGPLGHPPGAPRRSAVEAEAEAVEPAEPEVALAGAVLAVERPCVVVDADEAERLRRERERLLLARSRSGSPCCACRRGGRASPRRRSEWRPRRGRCSRSRRRRGRPSPGPRTRRTGCRCRSRRPTRG